MIACAITALFSCAKKFHTQIEKLKDGTKRDKQSVLINRFFKKEGGKLVSQENSAFFRDLRSRCEEKYKDSRSEGHHCRVCDSLSGCVHHLAWFACDLCLCLSVCFLLARLCVCISRRHPRDRGAEGRWRREAVRGDQTRRCEGVGGRGQCGVFSLSVAVAWHQGKCAVHPRDSTREANHEGRLHRGGCAGRQFALDDRRRCRCAP